MPAATGINVGIGRQSLPYDLGNESEFRLLRARLLLFLGEALGRGAAGDAVVELFLLELFQKGLVIFL
jgi:hypothetical protein